MRALSRLNRFFERRLAADGLTDICPEGRIIHDGLAGSIASDDLRPDGLRRPSMCHDGTPVVYSVRLGPHAVEAFRVLVEPGSLSHGVAQQIAFSLTVVDRLLAALSWQSAAADINTVTARTLPGDAAAADRCWGGIWLGTSVPRSAGPDARTELRMYVNLRHGDAASRWRRVAAVLTSLGTGTARDEIVAWTGTIAAHARPVGVALVIADGRVHGCRIYVVTAPASIAVLASLASGDGHPEDAAAGERSAASAIECLSDFCGSFDRTFGLPRSVTLGYDFENAASGLRPAVARFKVDLCCQLLEPPRKREVVPWIESVLTRWRQSAEPLHRFVFDLEAEWGRFDVEFVGIGLTSGSHHVTVYAKPDIRS